MECGGEVMHPDKMFWMIVGGFIVFWTAVIGLGIGVVIHEVWK
jgi:hypothetical protein